MPTQTPSYGILGQKAPEWDIPVWYNLPKGQNSLSLADLAGKVVYLYSFQSWCPGCHSAGFPSLVSAIEMFKEADDVAFVAVQTVFEGFGTNTAKKAKATADTFGLRIPIGHDTGLQNAGSGLMRDYRAGGTPWTAIIGKDGFVYFNAFHAPTGAICQLIDLLRAKE